MTSPVGGFSGYFSNLVAVVETADGSFTMVTGVPAPAAPLADEVKSLLILDRGVYKPGDKVCVSQVFSLNN